MKKELVAQSPSTSPKNLVSRTSVKESTSPISGKSTKHPVPEKSTAVLMKQTRGPTPETVSPYMKKSNTNRVKSPAKNVTSKVNGQISISNVAKADLPGNSVEKSKGSCSPKSCFTFSAPPKNFSGKHKKANYSETQRKSLPDLRALDPVLAKKTCTGIEELSESKEILVDSRSSPTEEKDDCVVYEPNASAVIQLEHSE
jgi:hypothetical protein